MWLEALEENDLEDRYDLNHIEQFQRCQTKKKVDEEGDCGL